MKITKKYFKAKTLLVIGCLSFACQGIAMGKTPEQWELHLEKTIPIKSDERLVYFSDEKGNDYFISWQDDRVTFTKNNVVTRTVNGYFIEDKTEDRRYYLLRTIRPAAQPETPPTDHLISCDYSGTELWQADGIGVNEYHLSPNGQYAVYCVPPIYTASEPPTFINGDGVVNSEVTNMKIIGFDKWKSQGFQIFKWNFSEKGGLFSVVVSEGDENQTVFVFNDRGYPVTFIENSIENISDMDFSEDEKNIAISGWNKQTGNLQVQVYEISTKKSLWEHDRRATTWGQDSNLIIVEPDGNTVSEWDVNSRQMVWKTNTRICSQIKSPRIKKFESFIGVLGLCEDESLKILTLLDIKGVIRVKHDVSKYQKKHTELKFIQIFNDKLIIEEESKISFFKIIK